MLTPTSKRLGLIGALVLVGGLGAWQVGLFSQPLPEVMVYKTPTCGCCSLWVNHLTENGFTVSTQDLTDLNPIKDKYGIEPRLQSCHTAVIGDYIFEGHVPAQFVKQVLEEKPDIRGLTVPGMPIGSPGMEQGNRRDPYDVLSIDHQGHIAVYAKQF